MFHLRHRELDASADRGAVGEGARQFQELVAEFARGAGPIDQAPVNHQFLRAETRSFDKAQRDALMRAGPDRINHVRVRDCRRVAFPLQQEFRMIDAARHVGRKHQEEIDLLGSARERRLACEERDERQP